MHIDQVLPMWDLVGVADAFRRHDDPESIGKCVHCRCPDTTAGHASGDDGRIDFVLRQESYQRSVEEHRRRVFAKREVVAFMMYPRVERQTFVAIEKVFMDRPDFPS